MKKIDSFKMLLLAAMICGSVTVSAQVAIGTGQSPTATLQVVGQPSDAIPAGVIAPNVTVTNLNAAAANYGMAQNSAIVYVTDATGASAATKTGNITAAGYYYFDGVADVWKGFGGSATGDQIRGNVVNVTQATYTVQPNDWAVITNYSSGVTVTFPNLTAADAGRTVLFFNNNTTPTANTIMNATGNLINNQWRGGTLMWTGTQWVMIDK